MYHFPVTVDYVGCNCDKALRTPRSPTVSSYGDGFCLFQNLYNVYLALFVEGRDHRASKMCAWWDGVLWFQCVDESPISQIFHISAAMKTPMSLVIAVALALDVGSLAAKAFVIIVCPFMRTELLSVLLTGVAFSKELWLFSKCLCIVLVLAEVYGISFLQCLHFVFVLSVIILPFLISTGKPKCCHTNDLNVAGASSIVTSPSHSIMPISARISSRSRETSRISQDTSDLARSRATRSRHTPNKNYF